VKKVNSTLPTKGWHPNIRENNPATRKALLDAAGSDAWASVDRRWKICVFCGAMKGRVLFFGWMNCRRRPLRTLDTNQKGRQSGADAWRLIRPATFPAICLEKRDPRNTKPA
jgi:hypothetical protein